MGVINTLQIIEESSQEGGSKIVASPMDAYDKNSLVQQVFCEWDKWPRELVFPAEQRALIKGKGIAWRVMLPS